MGELFKSFIKISLVVLLVPILLTLLLMPLVYSLSIVHDVDLVKSIYTAFSIVSVVTDAVVIGYIVTELNPEETNRVFLPKKDKQ